MLGKNVLLCNIVCGGGRGTCNVMEYGSDKQRPVAMSGGHLCKHRRVAQAGKAASAGLDFVWWGGSL